MSTGLTESKAIPMNYHSAYKIISKYLPKDAIIVNEGANTMDIGRTMLPNILPRHRYIHEHFRNGCIWRCIYKALFCNLSLATALLNDNGFSFSFMTKYLFNECPGEVSRTTPQK